MDGRLDVEETYSPLLGGNKALRERERQVIVVAALRRQFDLRAPDGPVEVDLASGAGYSYPAALMLILPPTAFPDEASRDAYFGEVYRSFDLAREALLLHTNEDCSVWNCSSRSERDDAVIAEWRRRFAVSRTKTQIEARISRDSAVVDADR